MRDTQNGGVDHLAVCIVSRAMGVMRRLLILTAGMDVRAAVSVMMLVAVAVVRLMRGCGILTY